MKLTIPVLTSSCSHRSIALIAIVYSTLILAACDGGSYLEQGIELSAPEKIRSVKALQYSEIYAEVSVNESAVQTIDFNINSSKRVPITGVRLDEYNTVLISWYETFEDLPLLLAQQQGEFFGDSETLTANADFTYDFNFDDDGDSIPNITERKEGECPRITCTSTPITFEAEDTHLSHTGHYDSEGIFATVEDPINQYLAFGPYTTEVGAGRRTAEFLLYLDNISADNQTIAEIDVHDSHHNVVLARKSLRRRDFSNPFQNSSFVLEFTSRIDSVLEFRVLYFGFSYIHFDKVVVR